MNVQTQPVKEHPVKRSPLLCSTLLGAVLLLTGCASSNVVPLHYPTQLQNFPWCRWDLTVTAFADQRSAPQVLGARDEQTRYMAGADVGDWVTRAVFEEMKARGCACTYAKTAEQAGTGFVISGQILQIQLDKVGLSTWKTQMKVRYVLTRNGQQLYAATHTGVVERPIVLKENAPSEILAEGLQDITIQAVEAMIPAMEKVQAF
jgi:hypothetical protein